MINIRLQKTYIFMTLMLLAINYIPLQINLTYFVSLIANIFCPLKMIFLDRFSILSSSVLKKTVKITMLLTFRQHKNNLLTLFCTV